MASADEIANIGAKLAVTGASVGLAVGVAKSFNLLGGDSNAKKKTKGKKKNYQAKSKKKKKKEMSSFFI